MKLNMNLLSVKGLTKRFNNFTAVDDLSFELKQGEILGLLGANGAGKTTTINMLVGLTLPDGGKIEYFGKDFAKHRQDSLQRINFASSFNTLQGRLTVYENLIVFSNLYSIKDPKDMIDDLCKRLEIHDLLHRQYWGLSAGQRTRVNLVKSLINNPEIILMDEPTASLDPDIADKLLSLIEEFRESKKLSIVYTSHDMNEVSRVCDRVIFLSNGKIEAEDTPLGLTKQIPYAKVQLTFDGTKASMEKLLKTNKFKYEFINNSIVLITTKEKDIPKVIFTMSSGGIWITDIDIQKPTLEDFFLQVARKK